MDIELARRMVRTAFECGAQLQDLMLPLKEQSDSEEYKRFARAIAEAIDATNMALMAPAMNEHPDLRSEIEESIKKTGRYR